MLIKWANPPADKSIVLDYTSFSKAVVADQVQDVTGTTDRSVNTYTVNMKDGKKHTVIGPTGDTALLQEMVKHNVTYKMDQPTEAPWWTSLLTTLLPIIVIVGLFFFMMQQTQGGGNRVMQFGKSRARLVGDEKRKLPLKMLLERTKLKKSYRKLLSF